MCTFIFKPSVCNNLLTQFYSTKLFMINTFTKKLHIFFTTNLISLYKMIKNILILFFFHPYLKNTQKP